MDHENHVQVGVKAWDYCQPAEAEGVWGASIGVLWVEVDGVRVPGIVQTVTHRPMRYDQFESVVIELICGKFETVPGTDVPETCARCGAPAGELDAKARTSWHWRVGWCAACARVVGLLADLP